MSKLALGGRERWGGNLEVFKASRVGGAEAMKKKKEVKESKKSTQDGKIFEN